MFRLQHTSSSRRRSRSRPLHRPCNILPALHSLLRYFPHARYITHFNVCTRTDFSPFSRSMLSKPHETIIRRCPVNAVPRAPEFDCLTASVFSVAEKHSLVCCSNQHRPFFFVLHSFRFLDCFRDDSYQIFSLGEPFRYLDQTKRQFVFLRRILQEV